MKMTGLGLRRLTSCHCHARLQLADARIATLELDLAAADHRAMSATVLNSYLLHRNAEQATDAERTSYLLHRNAVLEALAADEQAAEAADTRIASLLLRLSAQV